MDRIEESHQEGLGRLDKKALLSLGEGINEMHLPASEQAAELCFLDLLQEAILGALEDVKAQSVKIFDTRPQTRMFDRIIICTATSSRHALALADRVSQEVKRLKHSILSREGLGLGDWIIVDAADIVVHIMQSDSRVRYDLEGLWGENPIMLPARFSRSFSEPATLFLSEEKVSVSGFYVPKFSVLDDEAGEIFFESSENFPLKKPD